MKQFSEILKGYKKKQNHETTIWHDYIPERLSFYSHPRISVCQKKEALDYVKNTPWVQMSSGLIRLYVVNEMIEHLQYSSHFFSILRITSACDYLWQNAEIPFYQINTGLVYQPRIASRSVVLLWLSQFSINTSFT